MKNRCILATPAGDIVRKVIILFIALAMLITFAVMINDHYKLVGSLNKPVQIASDGGPIPTCGWPGHPCGPTDDSIIKKIIVIVLGERSA